jgi:hypothetical protein
MKTRIRVARSLAGPVLLQFGDVLNGFQIALSDAEAIALVDKLRFILESPTTAAPEGDNVIVMERP